VTEHAHDDPTEPLPAPDDPMAVARRLVERDHTDAAGLLTLRTWRGGFYRWDDGVWLEREDAAVRVWLYQNLEHAWYMKNGEVEPWKPNRNKVGNVAEALRAVIHIDALADPPAWLDGMMTPPAGELVAVRNGLLHVASRTLYPHTPRMFNLGQVALHYDPGAPPPTEWLGFLRRLWPDDPAAVAALQEFFGYVVSGDTRMHKMLLIIGPIRSGKGTIGRILTALVGKDNMAGPTLSSLTTNFGLAPLVGKMLAIISDARLGAGQNVQVVVERLLAISGEDAQTIDRKYREQWTGRLGTRFVVLTNELPAFRDPSGAVATRFVLLRLVESWLGREDHKLEEKLLLELPGILNWALDGLERLWRQDRFTVVPSAESMMAALRDITSPTEAFIRDRCVRGVERWAWVHSRYEDSWNKTTWKTERVLVAPGLYDAYREWCLLNGHHVSSKEVFGKNLRAVDPRIEMRRAGSEVPGRPYFYVGVGLA
jgi:putative DNA primase/helicase